MWLKIPSEHWNKFKNLNVVKKLVCNLSCVNNVPELDAKLKGDIKDKCFHPVEKELAQVVEKEKDLAQVVEKHQNSFKGAYHSKKSIKRNCEFINILIKSFVGYAQIVINLPNFDGLFHSHQ